MNAAALARDDRDAVTVAAVVSAGRGQSACLALTGTVALALGVLVYLTDRDAAHAQLVPAIAALAGSQVFSAPGQWLPSFVHPFAFSLFTAAALPPSAAPRDGVCATWCAVNVAFELGQHQQLSARLAEALQAGFGQGALARSLANYFVRGTFDVGDLVAAVLGAMAAAGVLRLMHRVSKDDHAS